ncbi:hypothetical protein HORIV_19760 [Vreelandella olivaria]|uniref:Uncharacterized protein n=1 Tax=Vreelandella olivaria TaxID=390919 RepID=A0ABM7GGK0_9GAMM|nr:hypothetical protein HORIV_19760 [Halomonas olivaria]
MAKAIVMRTTNQTAIQRAAPTTAGLKSCLRPTFFKPSAIGQEKRFGEIMAWRENLDQEADQAP